MPYFFVEYEGVFEVEVEADDEVEAFNIARNQFIAELENTPISEFTIEQTDEEKEN